MPENPSPNTTDLQDMPAAELVAVISRCGLDIPPGLPEEIVRRGGETGEALCALAADPAVWEADRDPNSWTPIFAIFLLGAIGDVRSAPVLVDVLRTRELGDFLCEGIAGILAWLGRGAVELIDGAARDAELDSFQRAMAVHALYGIGCRDPSARAEVAGRLTRLVRESDDPEFLGLVADVIARVEDAGAQRALDEAFEAGRVYDGMIALEDVKAIRKETRWTLTREVSDPMDFFSDASLGQLRRTQQGITAKRARAAERKAAEVHGLPQSSVGVHPTAIRATPKVGRNDPCPCGSGKKYKKCHGR